MPRNAQVVRQWLLLERLERSKGATLDELVDSLPSDHPCHARTVRRDLEALEARFPLITERRRGKTIWRFMDGFDRTIRLAFSQTELMALVFSKDLLRPLDGTELKSSLDSAFNKMVAVLPSDGTGFIAHRRCCTARSLVVRMVYKLAYRQTEGFLHSIASLLGLGIEIPDYSTLCRHSRLLRKKLRIPKAASTQPIHLMIDSTGLRIHVGNARKPPKLRAWRKLHIAVDRETGNIVASELTASRTRDATRVPALLTQIQAPLVSVAADSAYDKEAVYEAIEAHSPGRRTRVVIPPQRNATLSQNSNTAMQERDRHIRAIERHGRREWYKLSGYTKRSMVENAVYRYKAIIGPEMRARTLARQRVEHRIGCEILNKMAALGMPDTYCAG